MLGAKILQGGLSPLTTFLVGKICWEKSSQTRSPKVPDLTHLFFGWEGSATKIGHRKKGTLFLSSLLEDLEEFLESCLG